MRKQRISGKSAGFDEKKKKTAANNQILPPLLSFFGLVKLIFFGQFLRIAAFELGKTRSRKPRGHFVHFRDAPT